MNPLKTGLAVLMAVSMAAACSRAQPQREPYAAVATIQELMLTQVDAAADFLWASVSSISSAAGFVEKRPQTDAEWNTVRANALTLVEATNLLILPGRRVSAPGAKTADADLPGIESSANIQKAIDGDRGAFIGLAQGLRATGLKALAAIDRRDPEGLFEVGGEIDKACEQCHLKYWYPSGGS
jgi:cytochrome c556